MADSNVMNYIGDEQDSGDDQVVPKAAPVAPVNPDLHQSLSAGAQKIATSATSGTPGTPMEDRDSNYYLQELEKLSGDPQYHSSAPPSTLASLKEATEKARQLYQDKADRNEWLEVAQTLGRAATQYAGARAGMARGYNMAALPIPEIDYGKRTDRAARDYEMATHQAGLESTLSRQEATDADKAQAENFGRATIPLEKGLAAKLKGEAEESAETRADIRARATEGAADRRAAAGDARADARQREADTRLSLQERVRTVKDIDSQVKELDGQITAGRTLANALQQEDDLSPSEAKKLHEKYAPLAGKAGVDLPSAMDQYQKAAPTRNRKFLGMDVPGTSVIDKPKATATLYDALGLNEKIQKLRDLRSRKEALLAGGVSASSEKVQSATPPPPVPTASAPAGVASSDTATPPTATTPAPPPGRVAMRGPDGKLVSLPQEQVEAAKKQGYTLAQ